MCVFPGCAGRCGSGRVGIGLPACGWHRHFPRIRPPVSPLIDAVALMYVSPVLSPIFSAVGVFSVSPTSVQWTTTAQTILPPSQRASMRWWRLAVARWCCHDHSLGSTEGTSSFHPSEHGRQWKLWAKSRQFQYLAPWARRHFAQTARMWWSEAWSSRGLP